MYIKMEGLIAIGLFIVCVIWSLLRRNVKLENKLNRLWYEDLTREERTRITEKKETEEAEKSIAEPDKRWKELENKEAKLASDPRLYWRLRRMWEKRKREKFKKRIRNQIREILKRGEDPRDYIWGETSDGKPLDPYDLII